MSLEPIGPERAVELYLQDRESELSKRSQYGHKSRLGHFTRWCDEQDITNMNKLSGRDLHRFPGDLLTHACVTPSFGCRAVNVENRLAVCIDECRRFERLNPVIRPLAVVATRA